MLDGTQLELLKLLLTAPVASVYTLRKLYSATVLELGWWNPPPLPTLPRWLPLCENCVLHSGYVVSPVLQGWLLSL